MNDWFSDKCIRIHVRYFAKSIPFLTDLYFSIFRSRTMRFFQMRFFKNNRQIQFSNSNIK